MKFYGICFFVSAVTLMYTGELLAACGDTAAICYHYQGKQLISSSSCNISECADISGALQRWDWQDANVNLDFEEGAIKLNGKPGFSIKKFGLQCYGLQSNKSELFCSKDHS